MATRKTISAGEQALYTPSPVLSPGAAAMAIEEFEEYQAQLRALTYRIEQWLEAACNKGREPPDDAPLTEWRLMQIMCDMLDSSRTSDSLRTWMGQHLLKETEARQLRP